MLNNCSLQTTSSLAAQDGVPEQRSPVVAKTILLIRRSDAKRFEVLYSLYLKISEAKTYCFVMFLCLTVLLTCFLISIVFFQETTTVTECFTIYMVIGATNMIMKYVGTCGSMSCGPHSCDPL